MKTLTKKIASSLKALFFIQIFSTLSFSILYSTLVLYLTLELNFSDQIATKTTASVIAFYYALHLVGGYLGGKFFSFRSLFTIGMLLSIAGCVIISYPSRSFLYWGLAVFLTGSGFNVTCVNCMLTQLFDPHDKRREAAFLWNYSGMNIGYLIGFTLSGFFQITHHYQILFISSGFGGLFALIIHLINFRNLEDKDTTFRSAGKEKKRHYFIFGLFILLVMIISLKILLENPSFSNGLILFVGALMAFIVLILAMLQKSKEAAEKLFAYLILAFASLIFFALYELAPMGLTLFINRNVDRNILGFVIQPQWVLNINALIIIFGGPFLSYIFKKLRSKGRTISIPFQFTVALLLISAAFIVLPIGIYFADEKGMVNFGWVIACFTLQSLGELTISPIGYAMVGQLVPVKLRGLLMGVWMMIVGVAASISNIFSSWALSPSKNISPIDSNTGFSRTFFVISIGAFIASLLLMVIIPFINKLIKEKPVEENPPVVL